MSSAELQAPGEPPDAARRAGDALGRQESWIPESDLCDHTALQADGRRQGGGSRHISRPGLLCLPGPTARTHHCQTRRRRPNKPAGFQGPSAQIA